MRFFRNLFRGDTGNPGPPGPQGIQGPPGQVRYETEQDKKHMSMTADLVALLANAWLEDYNRVEQERDVARDGVSQLRAEIRKLYKEMDRLRKDLAVSQAVNRINARQEMANPRLEAMLEESYRNEFKRNIDNQKATDGANCPSS